MTKTRLLAVMRLFDRTIESVPPADRYVVDCDVILPVILLRVMVDDVDPPLGAVTVPVPYSKPCTFDPAKVTPPDVPLMVRVVDDWTVSVELAVIETDGASTVNVVADAVTMLVPPAWLIYTAPSVPLAAVAAPASMYTLPPSWPDVVEVVLPP